MNDELKLDSLLKQMADDHHADLPGPGLIWWRAQILKKQQEKERIERPVILMRLLATVVCAVAFVVLLARDWRHFHAAISESSWLLVIVGGLAVATFAGSVLLLWPRPSTKAKTISS